MSRACGPLRGCGLHRPLSVLPSLLLQPRPEWTPRVGPGSGVSYDVTDCHSTRQNRHPNPFDTGLSSPGPGARDPVAAAAFGGERAGGERHRRRAREAWTPPKGSARRPLSFLEPSRGLSRPCPPHCPPRPPFPCRAVGAGFALGAPLRWECSAGRGGGELWAFAVWKGCVNTEAPLSLRPLLSAGPRLLSTLVTPPGASLTSPTGRRALSSPGSAQATSALDLPPPRSEGLFLAFRGALPTASAGQSSCHGP